MSDSKNAFLFLSVKAVRMKVKKPTKTKVIKVKLLIDWVDIFHCFSIKWTLSQLAGVLLQACIKHNVLANRFAGTNVTTKIHEICIATSTRFVNSHKIDETAGPPIRSVGLQYLYTLTAVGSRS